LHDRESRRYVVGLDDAMMLMLGLSEIASGFSPLQLNSTYIRTGRFVFF
jgi:hypothetical protein